MVPAHGFDGEALLKTLQALHIDISQPMVRQNAHDYYEGLSTSHRVKSLTPLHEVRVVECMAPIISTHTWSNCIHPRLVRERGSGWGVDQSLFNFGCAPDYIYSLRMPLDHVDSQSGKAVSKIEKSGSDSKTKALDIDELHKFRI